MTFSARKTWGGFWQVRSVAGVVSLEQGVDLRLLNPIFPEAKLLSACIAQIKLIPPTM